MSNPRKRCFKCGIVKPLDDFYKHFAMADGHLNKCKECTKKDVRRHRRNSNRPREYDSERYHNNPTRRASVLSRKRDPKKKHAVTLVNNAVRDGKIIRAKSCEICGAIDRRIEGHHDDYDKPLEVRWLCALCHKRLHFAKPF